MRPYLSCFLLLFGLSSAKGQAPVKEEASPAPVTDSASLLSTYRHVTVKLGDPEREHPNDLPFHHFEILDERPDTLRIGAHTGAGFFGKGNRQLVFSGQASRELAHYLDARFSRPGGPFTALIVLRSLWFSDATYTLADLSKDTSVSHVKIRIRLKAEVYAEKDGIYTPLFRFDSTRQCRTGSNLFAGQDLAGMLDDLADSAATLIDRKGMGGRHLSLDDIRQFNRSRFDPVIYRDSTLVGGVYKDFQEFRDNAPSIHSFETQTENNKLLLYIKEAGGNLYYTRDAWGYCDGTNIYVMKDGMLVQAWKEGKAFYLLGQPEEGDFGRPSPGSAGAAIFMGSTPGGGSVSGVSAAQAPATATKISRHKAFLLHVFAVDMDTGKLY